MKPIARDDGVTPSRAESLWSHVRPLFELDDGSLPDIFVDGLSPVEVAAAYEYVMSLATVGGDPIAWHIGEARDVSIPALPFPARLVVDRVIEPFRHRLADLHVEGIELPQLTICVEPDAVSFDYRMGTGWNERTVEALFSLLAAIKQVAPGAVISQADEGGRHMPSKDFATAFAAYLARGT